MMDALEYLIRQPETNIVVFLVGWLCGIFVGGMVALVAVK